MSAPSTTSNIPVAKTYLLHGFRWPRKMIRIWIILEKLEDVSSDWIVASSSTETLVANFRRRFPALMEQLPSLRFVEQYDLRNTSGVAQPYAYVADVCENINLGVDIDEVRGRGIPSGQWGALQELRDELMAFDKAHNPKYEEPRLGWFVVHCADELRGAPGEDSAAEWLKQEADETEVEVEAADEGKTVGAAPGTPVANPRQQGTSKQAVSPFQRALLACTRKGRQG